MVRVTDAIRLCREGGCIEVPPAQAAHALEWLGQRDACRVREFVQRARVLTVPLPELGDNEVLAIVRQLLRSRELVVVQGSDQTKGPADNATVELRRLVRQIEQLFGGGLTFEGRRFRLVADLDLAKLSDRDHYEVVSRADAVRVLGGLAARPSGSVELHTLLRQASGKLSADWRPPFSPEGLVLLRRLVVAQAVNPEIQAPITPSQLKNLLKSDWIEIEVVDDEDEPHVGPFRLELADQEKIEGAFDGSGFFSKYNIASGDCKLVLVGDAVPAPEAEEPVAEEAPPTEEATPVPAVTAEDAAEGWEELPSLPTEPSITWLSLKLVDEQGNVIPHRRFKLELADQSTREGDFSDGQIRFDDVPPGPCSLVLLPADSPGL